MKIMYHVPGGVVGGAETHVQSLANNLPGGNHVLVTYENAAIEPFLKSKFNTTLLHRVFSPNSLIQKIAQFQPEIIQFYHSPLVYNALKKIKPRAKVVEVAHNRTSFGWDCSTYGKELTDVLVCVSPDAESHFLSKRHDCRTVVIPNGVDTSVFKRGFIRPGVTKRPVPLGGFCGRLEGGDGKGVQSLIEIVRELPVEFELVGYDFGGYAEKLRGTNIKVLPFTTDIERYYRNWDFFVSCSPKEGFGLAIAEAISCGLQCILLDCGGVTHYLKHDESAYIAKDLKDVKRGIKKFIKAYNDGGPFYDTASVDLSAKTMAASYYRLYQELLGGVAEEKTTSVKEERVLGVVPTDWYGIRHALEGQTDSMVTPDAAIATARKTGARKIVFGGFMPTWYQLAKDLKALGCDITVTYHSTPVLNLFGAANRQGLVHVIDAARKGIIDRIHCPHEGMAKTLNALSGVVADYAPNTLSPMENKARPKLKGINIGIFGTGLPWKNTDVQILAAAITPGLTKIHLQNVQDTSLIDQLGVPYEVHPYYRDRQIFYNLAGQMQVNLAVGLTETFGYFAAESYLLGTPAVFSVTTPSMRDAEGAVRKAMVSYIDDPCAVANAIQEVLNDYDAVLLSGQGHCKKLMRGES